MKIKDQKEGRKNGRKINKEKKAKRKKRSNEETRREGERIFVNSTNLRTVRTTIHRE